MNTRIKYSTANFLFRNMITFERHVSYGAIRCISKFPEYLPSMNITKAIRFLGAFANYEKRLLASSCLSVSQSVRPSVRTEQSSPTGQTFMKLVIWVFFEQTLEKIQVYLNLQRITVTLHEDQYIYFLSYLANFFLEWEMFQAKFEENIKTHFFPVTFFSTIVPFMR